MVDRDGKMKFSNIREYRNYWCDLYWTTLWYDLISILWPLLASFCGAKVTNVAIAKFYFFCHCIICIMVLVTDFAECLQGEAQRCIWNKLKESLKFSLLWTWLRAEVSPFVRWAKRSRIRENLFVTLSSTSKVPGAFSMFDDHRYR